jgi:hypothetical protein
MTLKTAGVLAGAYMRRYQGQPRTHLVEVIEWTKTSGWPVTRVLCGKADPANILDDSTQWTDERPSCPACAKKWDRIKQPVPGEIRNT